MDIKITFLRHGKAIDLPDGDSDDSTLPLIDVGIKQALDRRKKLGNPRFDLVISSPAARAKETAMLVAGIEDSVSVIEVPELYSCGYSEADDVLDGMLDELGNVPINKYYILEDGHVLRTMATLAWAQIRFKLTWNIRSEGNVLVCGHAVILPAIGDVAKPKEELFRDMVIGECEGFILHVNIKKGTVSSVEIIVN